MRGTEVRGFGIITCMIHDTHPVIGMSPGNSYFKEDKIEFLLNSLLEKYTEVTIMIADIPAISTYIALGYPKNRARTDKAIRNSNQLKNRVIRVLERASIDKNRVHILDWETLVEPNKLYQDTYSSAEALYNENEAFRNACNDTTRLVLEFSRKKIEDMDSAVSIAVHYLLSEFAFLEFAPELLKQKHITYVYHNNWPVYEDYISGVYDRVDKREYLGFHLLEHPEEMFIPLVQDIKLSENESALERIKRTGLIYTGYTEYDPAFILEEGKKKGIFHDLLERIASDNEFKVVWTEEIGYGAIVSALDERRFDIFASTVWPTEERKESALFSEPLYKSEVYMWKREKEPDVLSRQPLRIAVKENDISDSIAKDYSPRDNVYIEQLTDTKKLLEFVVTGRADVTFTEQGTAKLFNDTSTHKAVKASDEPVRIYDNSYIFRESEKELKVFFDTEIKRLKNEGFLEELFIKYIPDRSLYIFNN